MHNRTVFFLSIAIVALTSSIVWPCAGTPGAKIIVTDFWEDQYVGRDRMYRVAAKDLVTSGGLNLSALNANRVNLYCRGAAVPIAVEPVASDGSFTTGTLIKFWGEYPRDANRAKDPYTHDNVYHFVTDSPDAPVRFRPSSILRPLRDGQKARSDFNRRWRLERDVDLLTFMAPAGAIPSNTVWHNRISTAFHWNKVFLPKINDIAQDPIRLTLYLLGQTYLRDKDPDHAWDVIFNAKYNLGRAQWDGRTPYLFKAELTAAQIHEFDHTDWRQIEFVNAHPEPTIDGIVLDWIDLEYRAQLKADRDFLEYSFAAGEGADSVRLMPSFASSPIDVFDLTSGTRLRVSTLRDSATGLYHTSYHYPLDGRAARFAAVGSGGYLPPSGIRPWPAPYLKQLISAPQYLIIAHESQMQAVSPLAEFRRAGGLSTLVVNVEQIYNEYSHGVFSPASIRDFIDDLLDKPGGGPGLQYVFLVGDATDDYLNTGRLAWRRDSVNFVPTWQTPNSEVPVDYAPHYAWDDYFVLGRNGSAGPRAAVGRLPARSAKQVADYVAKVLEYESATRRPSAGADEPWRRRALLIASEGFSADAENLQKALPAAWSAVKTYARPRDGVLYYNMDAEVNALKSELAALRADSQKNAARIAEIENSIAQKEAALKEYRDENRRMQSSIVDAISSGVAVVFFAGHGSHDMWRTGSSMDAKYQTDMFTHSHVDELTNEGRYPLVFTATCFSMIYGAASPQIRHGVGVTLVQAARRGAIAGIGHVAKTSTSQGTAFATAVLRDLLQPGDGKRRLGDAFLAAKRQGGQSNTRGVALIGDPALEVRLLTPAITSPQAKGESGRSQP